jgi:hypothetical protein
MTATEVGRGARDGAAQPVAAPSAQRKVGRGGVLEAKGMATPLRGQGCAAAQADSSSCATQCSRHAGSVRPACSRGVSLMLGCAPVPTCRRSPAPPPGQWRRGTSAGPSRPRRRAASRPGAAAGRPPHAPAPGCCAARSTAALRRALCRAGPWPCAAARQGAPTGPARPRAPGLLHPAWTSTSAAARTGWLARRGTSRPPTRALPRAGCHPAGRWGRSCCCCWQRRWRLPLAPVIDALCAH